MYEDQVNYLLYQLLVSAYMWGLVDLSGVVFNPARTRTQAVLGIIRNNSLHIAVQWVMF